MFFVDEIHRLPRALEETFYPAMEDRCLPITVGQGAGARVVTLDLPPFTLIGATTRTGLLTTPLRDRFGIQHRLEHYVPEELADRPALRAAARRGHRRRRRGGDRAAQPGYAAGGQPAAQARARLRRGPPQRHRHGGGGAAALDLMQVDHEGLDRLDREILSAICEKFSGGPVGLSTLAVAVGEEQDTIEDVYEPYLLQRGLIERTPRGRAATRRAFEHLGLEPPGPRASVRARRARRLSGPAVYPQAAMARERYFICPHCGNRSMGDRPQRRLPPRGPGLREMRVRVPVRAARRLLPGARTPRSSPATRTGGSSTVAEARSS